MDVFYLKLRFNKELMMNFERHYYYDGTSFIYSVFLVIILKVLKKSNYQFFSRESLFRRNVPNQSEESINAEFRARSIINSTTFDQTNRSNTQTDESTNQFDLESWLRTQVFMNVDLLYRVSHET